jgi:hypothetical protein
MPDAVQPDCGDDDSVTSRRVRSHPGHIPRTGVPIAPPLLVGRDGESEGTLPDDTAVLSGISRNDPARWLSAVAYDRRPMPSART